MKFSIHSRRSLRVVDLHPLFGEYDFIVKIGGNVYENIREIMVHKIKTKGGIKVTKTSIGIKLVESTYAKNDSFFLFK